MFNKKISFILAAILIFIGVYSGVGQTAYSMQDKDTVPEISYAFVTEDGEYENPINGLSNKEAYNVQAREEGRYMGWIATLVVVFGGLALAVFGYFQKKKYAKD